MTELYTHDEMTCVMSHIEKSFGSVTNILHEIVSPDIHVDICVIPPHDESAYYTLVTMGMGAHRMNVPDELKEKLLERAVRSAMWKYRTCSRISRQSCLS